MTDVAESTDGRPLIGVLALQGGFEAHARMLARLGARTCEVRMPAQLRALDGLVIPGGESTTMTLGLEREGLAEPLRALAGEGTPILGSCAGLIMLDRDHLGLMDMRAQRNAFGRQLRSFEADLDLRGLPGGPIRGIFIRAPWIAEHGPEVEILGERRRARRGRAPGGDAGRRLPRRARPGRATAPDVPGHRRRPAPASGTPTDTAR